LTEWRIVERSACPASHHRRSNSQADRLVQPKVDIHGLNRGAARAFAKIIQTRDEYRLALIAEQMDVHAVGVVVRLNVKVAVWASVGRRVHANEGLVPIALLEDRVERLQARTKGIKAL
jgi:hypothetical protein